MPRVASPTEWFYLLHSESSGLFLRAEGDGSLGFGSRADDNACWSRTDVLAVSHLGNDDDELAVVLTSAVDGKKRLSLSEESEEGATIVRAGERGLRCTVDGVAGEVFRCVRGPADLPSVSLSHLREEGWVALPELVHPETVADMKAMMTRLQEENPPDPRAKRPGIPNIMNESASIARTAVHAVSLFVLEEYIGSPLQFGHPPGAAITKHQDPSEENYGRNTDFQSTADQGGWHSDYPFSSQQGINLENFPPELCFGCEYLCCVDAFSELNGATMIVPGSHRYGHRPPPEAQNEHPPGASHIEAPAGTCVIFDCKTWHRSHWNRSGSDRCAMLNNVIPRWIMPFADQTAAYTEFVSSGKADEWLTPRERADCDDVMRPRWGGMHGVDDRNHGVAYDPRGDRSVDNPLFDGRNQKALDDGYQHGRAARL